MPTTLLIAQAFGLLGVLLYLLSYQAKKRTGILIINTISRLFYVLQYLLLGAFDGMAMDLLGLISALLAGYSKHCSKLKKLLLFLGINLLMVAVGLALYRNIFSLLAIVAVVLDTSALWLQRERAIRLLSLASAPLWLIFNLANLAFGSALGNAMAMVSILIALVRYDFRKSESPQ